MRDARAKARIAARVQRLALGNPGDWKVVGGGVLELRIDYGPVIACTAHIVDSG
jgi:putative addiction module killer protein